MALPLLSTATHRTGEPQETATLPRDGSIATGFDHATPSKLTASPLSTAMQKVVLAHESAPVVMLLLSRKGKNAQLVPSNLDASKPPASDTQNVTETHETPPGPPPNESTWVGADQLAPS